MGRSDGKDLFDHGQMIQGGGNNGNSITLPDQGGDGGMGPDPDAGRHFLRPSGIDIVHSHHFDVRQLRQDSCMMLPQITDSDNSDLQSHVTPRTQIPYRSAVSRKCPVSRIRDFPASSARTRPPTSAMSSSVFIPTEGRSNRKS